MCTSINIFYPDSLLSISATAVAAELAAATVITKLDSVAANTYLNMDQDSESTSMVSADSDYIAIDAQSQPQSLL